jgi:hypothetical protein
MLNELSLVADSLERLGINPVPRHPRINPMGKNKTMLVVGLDASAIPSTFEFFPGEVAGKLFRIEQGSAGSSFPGFNIPVPLCGLASIDKNQVAPLLENLIAFAKDKKAGSASIRDVINALFKISSPRVFTGLQEKQFQRSCRQLVSELHDLLTPVAPPTFQNFIRLLDILKKHPPALSDFSWQLASLLGASTSDTPLSRDDLILVQTILFGLLDWKKRTEDIASDAYWKTKATQDKQTNNASVPIYLDLAPSAADLINAKRVAHGETSVLLNKSLIAASNTQESSETDGDDASKGIDAFSGKRVRLQDRFPSPKIAELGNVVLFSVNTKEVPALFRYKLGGPKIFPAAATRVQKMQDALLFLADDSKIKSTCLPIPGAQSGKRDLLIAYLENDTTAKGDDIPGMAEMFGCETNALGVSEGDFSERTKNVLQLFSAKLHSNPDLGVRLIALGTIDKGRKQATLNRAYRVSDVLEHARQWNDAACNIPPISIISHFEETPDSASTATQKQSGKKRKTKKQKTNVPVRRMAGVPSPVDLVVTINRVWSSDAKAGFTAAYQRAFSMADAYDVFIPVAPQVAKVKTRLALSLLVARMANVLGTIGAAKIARQDARLNDTVREQTLKTVALLGLLLKKLNPITNHKDTYMKEPLYQLGQLLALADSLHQQYCKHVRDNQRPSQLMGNALFNTALEQPRTALARLAERIAPYHAWAKNYKREDGGHGIWPAGKIKICAKRFIEDVNGTFHVRTDELPERMSDEDKAKLLIGYLADTYEPEKTSAPGEAEAPSEKEDAS